MLPYIILILLPIPFVLVSKIKKNNGDTVLRLQLIQHENITTDEKNLLLPVFFGCLFLLLMCRGKTVGNDTQQYSYLFELHGTSSISMIIREGRDVLFRLLAHFVYRVFGNYQVFLAVIALLEVIPIAYVYLKDRSHSYLKMILFVNMATFCMMFSGIRQAVAISFGVLAYDFITRKKIWGYIICCLISFGFHTSGIVVSLFFLISKIKFRKKSVIWAAILTGIVLMFNRQIFNTLMRLYDMVSSREYDAITSTGAYTSLILFILFAIYSFWISKDEIMDEDAYVLRSFLVMTVLLQCFAPLHSLAMRVNYYFIILIPLQIGKCLKYKDEHLGDLAKISEIVLCVFFTGYFIYTLVKGYITGDSPLNIIPYIPFWAE